MSSNETKPPLYKKPWVNLAVGLVVGAGAIGIAWTATASAMNRHVVASVGSNQITQSEFGKLTTSVGGSQALYQLVTEQLVKSGAAKYHISASTNDISDALKNLESQNNITTPDQLQTLLDQNGLTMADLNNLLEVQVLETKLSEKDVKVTDKEVQDYYNQNKSSFATQSGTPPLSQVKSKIEDALKSQKATPTSQLLSNLAKEYNIVIHDAQFSQVKDSIENPAPASQSPLG